MTRFSAPVFRPPEKAAGLSKTNDFRGPWHVRMLLLLAASLITLSSRTPERRGIRHLERAHERHRWGVRTLRKRRSTETTVNPARSMNRRGCSATSETRSTTRVTRSANRKRGGGFGRHEKPKHRTQTSDRADSDKESLAVLRMVVSAVKGHPAAGDDSKLYGAMGYVRHSERKSRLKRPRKVVPIENAA